MLYFLLFCIIIVYLPIAFVLYFCVVLLLPVPIYRVYYYSKFDYSNEYKA